MTCCGGGECCCCTAMGTKLYCDPFVWFAVFCFALPNFFLGSAQEMFAFLTHWTCLVALGGLLAMYYYVHYVGPATVKLTPGRQWAARWYLLNGIVFHMMLDGGVGLFKANPVFAAQYKELDKRYGEQIGSMVGSAVHVLSGCELLLYGPMCLALYNAYHRGRKERDALELIVCTCQVFGTIIYAGQELITGMENTEVDYDLTFSFRYLKNFWFAFVFGVLVWLIVPTILGYKAWCRVAARAEDVTPPSVPQTQTQKKAVEETVEEEEEKEETPRRSSTRKSTRSASSARKKKN